MDDIEYIPDPVFLSDLKAGSILRATVVAVLIGLISDIPSTHGKIFLAAKFVLAVVLVLSVFSPVRFGIGALLMLLVVGTDIGQAGSEVLEVGAVTKASIWNLNIGFIRPSWVTAGICLLHIAKLRRLQLDRCVKLAILWSASIPFVTGLIYGSINLSPVARTQAITDIKFGLMLLISIILFRSFLAANPLDTVLLITVFIGSLFGRLTIDLAYWLLGKGALISGVAVRVSVDSAKGCVVLLLLYSIYLALMRKRYLFGTFTGICCCLLLVVYTTRMLWVTAVVGVAVLLWIFGFKRGLLALPIVIIVLFGGIFVLQKLRPESAWVISKKAESLTGTSRGGNFLQRVDPLRYAEMVNSTQVSLRRGALLWGNGYGSYYTDDTLPFPRELTDAFPEYSAATGQFYVIHNYFPHIMFKHGLIGLVLFTALWFVPGWRCYKIGRQDPTIMGGVLACLVAFLATAILHLHWSGKGLFINGFIIAVLYTFAQQYEDMRTDALEQE